MLTVYGHDACPMLLVICSILDRSQVQYDYIDVRHDQHAYKQVMRINHGFLSVPTLLFADGTHLTEPSTIDLRHKLLEYGVEMICPDRRYLMAMLLFGWKFAFHDTQDNQLI
ncbi:MAG: glutaredoxin domain-containing protein [Anaerolineae bacterium]